MNGLGCSITNYRSAGVLKFLDFLSLASGSLTTFPDTNLTMVRSGAGNTVQTSDSTLVSGIAANKFRIGQRTSSSSTRGLVVEESRVNSIVQSNTMSNAAWTNVSGIITTGFVAGPDGVVTDRVTGAAGSSVYQLVANTHGLNSVSGWHRSGTGSSSWQTGVYDNTFTAISFSFGTTGTTWSRFDAEVTTTTDVNVVAFDAGDNSINPSPTGISPTSMDNVLDFFQLESGDFPTEAIPTTAAPVTRSGEHLNYGSLSSLLDSGRLSLYLKLIPKGGSAEYSADMYLWYADANNNALVSHSNGKITVTIGGVGFTTTTGMTWNRYDTLEVFVAAGGTSLVTNARYRVNGGTAVNLGSSGSAQGVISGSSVDLLCSSTTNQFSAWLQQIAAFQSGLKPSWA